jgi:hypothetical protein
MGNIGDAISETIPAVGTSGTTYATNINAFLTEVKTRLEAQVPRASLASGALDLSSQPLQNASYLGVANGGSAPTTPTSTIQAYNGNLYWVHAAGAVQITSGNTLNTSLVGAITGDYGGANPAQFRFVDADQEYYAYDDFAGGAWARLWAKNVDIAAGATSSLRVRLGFGGAGSYTLTLPPAVPGSAAVLQMDTAGNVTASSTLTTSITASDFKYTTAQTLVVNPNEYREVTVGSHTLVSCARWQLGNSTNEITVPVNVRVGDQITGYTVYANKASDATNTLTARLDKHDNAGAQTIVATATNNAAAPGAISLTPGALTETVTGTVSYAIRLFQNDATPSAIDNFYLTAITIKRP